MNAERARDEDEREDENGDVGEAAGDEEDVDEAPPFTLGGNEGLGNQWMMVADDELAATFGNDVSAALQQGNVTWAVRFSGEGLDGPSADPLKTADLLKRVAMAARWIGNGLFPGRGAPPGFVVGAAAHSIVIQFALAREERPVRVRPPSETPGEDEPAGEAALRGSVETVELYPSVEGGRYFAKLLASNTDPDDLVARLAPVGKQAVRVYQSALKQFSDGEAELDIVVPSIEPDGAPVLRRVNNPPENSRRGFDVLDRVPEDVSRTIEVEGLLYTQDSLATKFGIAPDRGPHIRGEYDISVADKLGPAWNKRVKARIQEIGPREDWMPRAGHTRRVLKDVQVLHD